MQNVVSTRTVTLGASNTLLGYGFTAEQIADSMSIMIEPHAANAWVKLDGTAAADSDGHRIGQNELRQLDYQSNLDDLRLFGSGAATLTLLNTLE